MKMLAHEVILDQLESYFKSAHNVVHSSLSRDNGGMVSIENLGIILMFYASSRALLVTLSNMKLPNDIREKVVKDLGKLQERFPAFWLFLPLGDVCDNILKEEQK